jgi:hypothetical protein
MRNTIAQRDKYDQECNKLNKSGNAMRCIGCNAQEWQWTRMISQPTRNDKKKNKEKKKHTKKKKKRNNAN